MTDITRLNSQDPAFQQALEKLLTRGEATDRQINSTVEEIIAAVRARGDAAVIEMTGRFDNWTVGSAAEL
ncbi:MAG: histidinol dehydrogenase, partial [Gammaproteobacteria bacterium]|nr:histidinol dehydrogenase [Gammaproteobacteria bacterium]